MLVLHGKVLRSPIYADKPVASLGIRKRKANGMKEQTNWITMPRGRLLKEPEEISNIDANQAPTNEPTVFPKLFIDMNRANKVPSMPGGQSCPDKIRNGINLFLDQKKTPKWRVKQ